MLAMHLYMQGERIATARCTFSEAHALMAAIKMAMGDTGKKQG
jgi:hypothetical protein